MSEQKEQQIVSKTGLTPEAVQDIPGRQVRRVAELRIAMVEYIDDTNPIPVTRMVIVQPGGQVVFLDDKVIGKPAQNWFSTAVTKKLGGG